MAFAFSSLFLAITTSLQPRERIPCFHCNEQMRKEKALMATFNGTSYPVCCHGCLAVLKTIERNGLTQQYLLEKYGTEKMHHPSDL